jgi:two-component system CheB/CheR fusion protein
LKQLRYNVASRPAADTTPDASVWYSQLLEYTHDAIMVWAMGGKGIIFWNRSAEDLYGYARQAVYGKIAHDLLRTKVSNLADIEKSMASKGLWAGDLRHTTRVGRQVVVRTRMIMLPQVNGQWHVAEFGRELKR